MVKKRSFSSAKIGAKPEADYQDLPKQDQIKFAQQELAKVQKTQAA